MTASSLPVSFLYGSYRPGLWMERQSNTYPPPFPEGSSGIPFLKDAPFVLLCKLFGRKIVLHQHSKGMSTCSRKPLYRWLLPLVYRKTTVILLSWQLYDDVADVVTREQVKICPNGL